MANILETIASLSEMEDSAARIYSKASQAVRGDAGLRALLKGLAFEEIEHRRMLADIGGFMGPAAGAASLELDADAVARTRDYLNIAEKRIDAGRLTNANLIDCVATTESSEWNREFLKVVDWVKPRSRSFIPQIARVQQHKRSVERFLASRPGFERFLAGMKALAPVWDERLLVVDDDEPVRDALAALLGDEGLVDTAADGREALDKIAGGYYAAVVSDYSMPLVNGVELMNGAEQMFPGISRRFVFFTSDGEAAGVLRERGLRAVEKGASDANLAAEVVAVLKGRA